MRTARRAGLSRPEVLVVVSLVLVVVGLALPAVAKARAQSNREICRNNLKTLGQATLKFADDHGGLLPTIGGGQTPGIIVRILPYTDEHKVAESLTASGKPWHDPVNAAIVAKPLSFAQCPDTPKPNRILSGKIGDDSFKAAPTDYTGISLITEAIRDIFPENHDRSTALGGLSGRGTMSEITDGLSCSLIGIVEIADKPNRWQAGKLTESRGNMGAEGTWVANGFNAPRGYTWDGKTAPGPCAMNCSNSAAIYSFHPEGCNFLFADASVRFMKKDVDVWIFYAVTTRRGGELLANGDY